MKLVPLIATASLQAGILQAQATESKYCKQSWDSTTYDACIKEHFEVVIAESACDLATEKHDKRVKCKTYKIALKAFKKSAKKTLKEEKKKKKQQQQADKQKQGKDEDESKEQDNEQQNNQFLMFQSNRFAAKPIRLNRKPVRLKQNRYVALWDPNISFIVV